MTIDIKNIALKTYLTMPILYWLFSEVLNSNVHNIVPLSLLLIYTGNKIILNKNYFISKQSIYIILISVFVLITILFLFFNKEILINTIIYYNLYFFVELFLLTIILYRLSIHDFEQLILFLRNIFLIIMVPLLLLYFIDILDIYNFENRFIVFNGFRFGGLMSEPRGVAFYTIILLSSIFFIKRKNYQVLETTLLLIILISTFSNVIFLSLPVIVTIYFFIKVDIFKKILFLFSTLIIIYIVYLILPDSIQLGRFILEKDYIIQLLININNIERDLVNPFNLRLYNFVINFIDIPWIGSGITSGDEIYKYTYDLPYGKGSIGFTKLLNDLGILPTLVIILYIYYIIRKFNKINNIFILLVVSFSMWLLMASPYHKIFLFIFIYFILNYKFILSYYRQNSFYYRTGQIND